MSNLSRKIQKNAEQFMIEEIYRKMTPEQYKEGINLAIKKTEEKLTTRYNNELARLTEEYNKSIQESMLVAMDTLATEIIYELGDVLGCYKEEPEYLDQKIELVQNIYEKAMKGIEDYASSKYKNQKQAQKEFVRKQKIIKKIFGMEVETYGQKKN